jgi:hypothetical protein
MSEKENQVKKGNFHYHFAFRFLPLLFFEHYDVFKDVLRQGPSHMRFWLTEKWKSLAEKNVGEFHSTELLNTCECDKPFNFSLVKREGKPDLFAIYMPQMAEPIDTIEALVIAVVMHDDTPEVFVCEYDALTIADMKKAGAPASYSETHYVVERVDGVGKFALLGKCYKFSEFFAKIEEVERKEP